MRRFRDIVEDIKAPSPQSLWLDKGKLKFFGTKGWTLVAGEEGPDLSGYVKLHSSPIFTKVTCNASGVNNALAVYGRSFIEYLTVRSTIKSNNSGPGTPVFGQKGVSIDVGSEESFVFTLEDGSKVTKSIRVISTTTTPAT